MFLGLGWVDAHAENPIVVIEAVPASKIFNLSKAHLPLSRFIVFANLVV